MSINEVCLSGNLTADPVLRQTTSGTAILSFGMAVNDRIKGQDGQWTDRPNYIDCIVFGTRADGLSRFMRKGMKVAVEGKLRYSSWQGKDGQKRSKLEVVCSEVDVMQRDRAQQQDQPKASTARQQAPTQEQPAEVPLYDEDLPF